ncbi:LysR family transcriptional regulator substrate-binding protein [Actinoallomurus sp. NBC_01490]|uniref:LysR family transcriptional regulator substrate-binding protein n=1 Tax=Actinoallomurus sp. NBC_01490 TaxID=2903557 RepID=UPI002E349697|nr:LysR family transcriptional regulator substrate-binding protein [Actinoallomurus sp. NBC_01490]
MLDLALMAACEQTPADAHHLGDEEFVVVLGAGHRQLAADRVELRELEREPWVRFDRDSALDGVLLNVLRENELTPTGRPRVPDGDGRTLGRPRAGGDTRDGLRGAPRS